MDKKLTDKKRDKLIKIILDDRLNSGENYLTDIIMYGCPGLDSWPDYQLIEEVELIKERE